jgi:hypothetical protein
MMYFSLFIIPVVLATTIMLMFPQAGFFSLIIGFVVIILTMVLSSIRQDKPIVVPLSESKSLFEKFDLSGMEKKIIWLGLLFSLSGAISICVHVTR